MKKRFGKYSVAFFAACGVFIAGLTGVQRLCLSRAQKKKDETFFQEYFSSSVGEIAYRSGGHGRPLLLLHSMMLGASSREWERVFQALAEEYHVYALDLPGFGNSVRPEKPWTAYQYARLVHEFREMVIKRPVCVVAANGGADIALIHSMLFPDEIRRLILVSPEGIGKGFATPEDTKELSLLLSPIIGTQRFLLGTSKKKIREMLEGAFFAKEQVSKELVEIYQNSARYGKNAQTTFANIQTRFYAADVKKAFQELSVPFLMIWGEKNKDNPERFFDEAEKMKDRGEFALFEETGALPHLENSAAFLENSMEFLK